MSYSKLAVLLPAHNEEVQLLETLRSLTSQSRKADKIIVVSDNSTDRTVQIAKEYAELDDSVVVMETRDNPYRKSGALNQALALASSIMPRLDYVFTMDADTVLSQDFFEKAVTLMDRSSDVGGACACPMLKDEDPELTTWQSILWRMGKVDFGGYMRNLVRWKMKPEVLFGYATMFRHTALLEILEDAGEVWATNSIVEDYKASLDLRRNGWNLKIIPGAKAYTDVPTSMRELWIQRLRWAGGTWQELARAGWTTYTWRVWLTVLGCTASAVLRVLAIIAWVLVFSLGMEIAWSPIWLIPIVIGVVDRIDITRYTAKADWKDRVLVGSFIPLELMGIVRESWTVWSGLIVATKSRLSW